MISDLAMDTPHAAPTVAAVVPVYNRLSYLGATLDSVLAQTFADWELIVVDDGSHEDVAGFVAQYSDPRVRFVRQENQGNAVARNTGISQGASRYVICLDSDDVWHPDMLQRTVEFLETHPDADLVYAQVQSIDGQGQPLTRPVGPPPRQGDLLPDLLMAYPMLPSSALVRRSCFEHWGGYAPGLDDWELWLRWAAQGCRFACLEKPLLFYRIHDENFNLDWSRRRTTHFRMLDAFFAQEPLPEVAHRMRERAYANQHFSFAVLGWQVGRPADGLAEFIAAALRHPAYLSDLDFYTQVACAHQGRIDAGTERRLSLDTADSTLVEALAALFAHPDLPQKVEGQRAAAHGWAHFALARLAYGVAHDMVHARCYLWQAIRVWPALLWRSDWALWLVRSMVGFRTMQAVKRVFRQVVKRA